MAAAIDGDGEEEAVAALLHVLVLVLVMIDWRYCTRARGGGLEIVVCSPVMLVLSPTSS